MLYLFIAQVRVALQFLQDHHQLRLTPFENFRLRNFDLHWDLSVWNWRRGSWVHEAMSTLAGLGLFQSLSLVVVIMKIATQLESYTD